jgi:hypothetical protein
MTEYNIENLTILASQFCPVEHGEIYFYNLIGNFKITDKIMHDFDSWAVTVVSEEGSSIIITGSTPIENITDYVLLHHDDSYIKPEINNTEELVPDSE